MQEVEASSKSQKEPTLTLYDLIHSVSKSMRQYISLGYASTSVVLHHTAPENGPMSIPAVVTHRQDIDKFLLLISQWDRFWACMISCVPTLLWSVQ